MPVGKGAEVSVLFAAGGDCFFHERIIESIALFHQGLVLGVCLVEHVHDAGVAVGVPVRTQVPAEILDGIDVIISDEEFA